MATKKPVKKAVAKKIAPVKSKAKPVKKVAPIKKAAKPLAKASKPAPKKVAAKKPVAKIVKKAIVKKPVVAPAKKVVAKSKPIVKKAVIVKAKPVVKKALPPVKTKEIVKKVVVAPLKKTTLAPVNKTIVSKPQIKTPPPPPVKKVVAKNPKDIKITPAKPVAVPKINTKIARTYQPDFTKSVLDKYKNDPGAPIVKYSDTELGEFRELIHRKLDAAKKELNYLQGLITRKDNMGGDESESRYMTMEDGSLSMEREQLSQMASRQITFIDHLEKALMRIENKTYGICRITGRLIDKARLRAVPHATLSIEAKMGNLK